MADRLPDQSGSPSAFMRARAIFESALATDGVERERLLEDSCGNDGALRATVERMLRADKAPHALLDGSPVLARDRWATGDVFLHFQIGELIGRGGMGEVYQARDLSLNRDVALKVLPVEANSAGDDERMTRLRAEAHTLAALNHLNIATIHGLVEVDGVRALVLELVDGQTLAERLAEGPMPIGDAIRYARQIAGALEAAHEQGIVHRDLKPSNVKRRPDGTVKLLDFGLAKIVRPAVGTGAAPNMTSGRLVRCCSRCSWETACLRAATCLKRSPLSQQARSRGPGCRRRRRCPSGSC
jgi:serine/threonine-protein kinase